MENGGLPDAGKRTKKRGNKKSAGADEASQCFDLLAECFVRRRVLVHGLARMDDRAVVSSAEMEADRLQ